jgi:integrase
MKFAITEKNLHVDNPCQGIRLPRTVPAESVYLTEQEFAVLYAVIPDRWKLLVGMLAGTGCRWGEATALRWNDLDLDAAVPVLHISRAQKHGVDGNDRVDGNTKTKRS